jgi:flagellar hook-associated protein 1
MTALMGIGKSAMFASYAALQTTGNNIANANTVGYSRQSAQLADAKGQFSGSGYFGKGVNVTTVTRAYDQHLTNHAVATNSVAASDAVRAEKLGQLEEVFATGTSGIGYSAGAFVNSFVDLANAPADGSARQVVLSQAQELAARFRSAGEQVASLQTSVAQDLKASVASVNSMAKQIGALNREVAALNGTGQPANQLLDERDQLVAEIAKLINVTTVKADDGSMGLFIGGGQNLVLGADVSTLKAIPDAFDPARLQLALVEGAKERLMPEDAFAGGSISGLLHFQNTDLVDAKNLLGQMASAISAKVNAQQALGLDLRQPAGSGAPIFAVGAARVLGASANTGTAALSITVTSGSQLQPSDYELRFDGSAYALTRLSDKSVVTGSPFTAAQLAAGVSFDGVSVQLTAGAAQASDRFLLQPTALAAQAMTTVLADPKGLAAASPFTGSMSATNTGTSTLASLTAVSPAYNGSLTAAITFTSNTGDYNWSLSNGTSGTATWAAGAPISLNGFELMLAGVPRSGDTINVKPTVSVGGNNGNALAMSKLGDVPLVGISSNSAGMSITDAYADAISNIGVRVQSGKAAAGISQAIAADAETARANKSGVNLDEEAARLIQFQQSYQAAAKILQVAQSIFESMLQAAAR